MGSAVKWPLNPGVNFWPVDGAKAENVFAFEAKPPDACVNSAIPEIFKAGDSGLLPLCTQLFRVHQAGNFKIWIN